MQYIKKVKYRSIVHEMSERSVLCCDVGGTLVREEAWMWSSRSVTKQSSVLLLCLKADTYQNTKQFRKQKTIKHYINPKTWAKLTYNLWRDTTKRKAMPALFIHKYILLYPNTCIYRCPPPFTFFSYCVCHCIHTSLLQNIHMTALYNCCPKWHRHIMSG